MFFRAKLLDILSCDWWGEETGHVLTGHSWCSVIDPNDGTSGFLRGFKGSAISVGLLHNSQPVLGVVHATVTPEGVSDCIAWADGMGQLLRNGIPIHADLSHQKLTDKSQVMISLHETSWIKLSFYLRKSIGGSRSYFAVSEPPLPLFSAAKRPTEPSNEWWLENTHNDPSPTTLDYRKFVALWGLQIMLVVSKTSRWSPPVASMSALTSQTASSILNE